MQFSLRLAMHRGVLLGRAMLCGAILLAGGCGSPDSPQAQVRRVVDQMEAAAEQRDVGDLMAFVADDFRDAYGQNREELARYLRGYFIANQSIRLLTRIDEVSFPWSDEARARITVAMVGREADAAAAWNLAADLHEFDVTLRRQGEAWTVTYVKWQRE